MERKEEISEIHQGCHQDIMQINKSLFSLTSDAYSPHCSLYISKGADKENLCKNQELL